MLKNYLVLLQDKHLSACLYLAQSDLWFGPYRALLANIGIDTAALPAQGPALVLVDRLAGSVSVLQPGQEVDSGFGAFSLSQVEDGTYSVRVNGIDVLLADTDAVAGIVAMSNTDRALSTAAQFSSGPDGESKMTE